MGELYNINKKYYFGCNRARNQWYNRCIIKPIKIILTYGLF